MNKLIFVEGLWNTGKSYFIESVKINSKLSDKVFIADNLRNLGSIRHAAYSLYPKLMPKQNILFDRSPVTMKVISNSGFYTSEFIKNKYWDSYYNEWLSTLKELDSKIIFIYFRPFYENSNDIKEEILHHLKNYTKTELRINPESLTLLDLFNLHTEFSNTINSLYKEFKNKFTYYQVEYKDTKEAMDVLVYEAFMKSLGKEK
jgi:hypothetical protein